MGLALDDLKVVAIPPPEVADICVEEYPVTTPPAPPTYCMATPQPLPLTAWSVMMPLVTVGRVQDKSNLLKSTC